MDTPLPAQHAAIQTKKRKALGVLLVLAFLEGAIVYNIPEDSFNLQVFHWGCLLINTVVSMQWFFLDAKERHFRLTKIWVLMLVGIGIVSMPYYLIRTRGKKCLLPLLYFLLFAALFFIALFAGAFTSYLATELWHG